MHIALAIILLLDVACICFSATQPSIFLFVRQALRKGRHTLSCKNQCRQASTACMVEISKVRFILRAEQSATTLLTARTHVVELHLPLCDIAKAQHT